MISIIICSINKLLFEQVSKSIAETIGVEYEIVQIENTITNYGICKAYNIGATKAKFPFLCFLHEDILIKSSNWGVEIINFFEQNENIGIVGVAGSTYKSLVPSVWAQGLHHTDHANLIQHYRTSISMNSENPDHKFSEVKTLDGVFLFTKNKIWAQYPFDENTFDKFHCYDLDFCLQIGQHTKIFVFNNLLIEHFSSGSLNRDWVNYSIKLSEKWKSLLPVGNILAHKKKEIEWRNRKIFFLRMNILGYPILTSFKIFLKWHFIKNTSFVNLVKFISNVIGQKLNLLKKKPLY
ncbi:MAG: glycosyltransferase [Pedobacter sp.]|jgi:glycosyltransferase involved in cell wall biosynthesis|uniref:glycosyltransferase n=1 Tax=Pedobacter sp. TaxID=1411316 RepID=UPI003568D3C9